MSYCECDYDGVTPEFYSEDKRKARKTHTCYECNGPIAIGDTYVQRGGKWDGSVTNYPECSLCAELEQWAKITMPCFCYSTFGELHDNCRDMVDDIKSVVPGIVFEWGRRIIKIQCHSGKRTKKKTREKEQER